MPARMHQIRFSREQREQVRANASLNTQTKEAYLADVAARLAQRDTDDEPEWFSTKLVLDDDVWQRLTLMARARGMTVSALIAEAAA